MFRDAGTGRNGTGRWNEPVLEEEDARNGEREKERKIEREQRATPAEREREVSSC